NSNKSNTSGVKCIIKAIKGYHTYQQHICGTERRVSTPAAPGDDSLLHTLLGQMLKDPDLLQQIYFAKISVKEVVDETQKYFNSIEQFSHRYIENWHSLFDDEVTIVRGVEDIEETVRSPRYGLRGRIDVTLNVEDAKSKAFILPLEIKSGKSIPYVEHQGQVCAFLR
ncbi:unnamed protein product, partial [Soboliphyme baturini]|uniref:DNA replication ATP-dependent helicase/nuclease DNA2 n=1 Tax=Soboliphyme baturini TaxID=241478 RepID=A0A183IY36_9BILA